jgi:hypothetical protein
MRYNGSKLSIITIIAGLAIAAFTLSSPKCSPRDIKATSSDLTKPLLAIVAAIAIAGGLIVLEMLSKV